MNSIKEIYSELESDYSRFLGIDIKNNIIVPNFLLTSFYLH